METNRKHCAKISSRPQSPSRSPARRHPHIHTHPYRHKQAQTHPHTHTYTLTNNVHAKVQRTVLMPPHAYQVQRWWTPRVDRDSRLTPLCLLNMLNMSPGHKFGPQYVSRTRFWARRLACVACGVAIQGVMLIESLRDAWWVLDKWTLKVKRCLGECWIYGGTRFTIHTVFAANKAPGRVIYMGVYSANRERPRVFLVSPVFLGAWARAWIVSPFAGRVGTCLNRVRVFFLCVRQCPVFTRRKYSLLSCLRSLSPSCCFAEYLVSRSPQSLPAPSHWMHVFLRTRDVLSPFLLHPHDPVPSWMRGCYASSYNKCI